MDKQRAEKLLAEAGEQIKKLEAEIETLTGSANKKARNAKSREIADIKKGEDYVDAERVLAGKEPLQDRNKDGSSPKAEKKGEDFGDMSKLKSPKAEKKGEDS